MKDDLPAWAERLGPLLAECHRRLSTGSLVDRIRLGVTDRGTQDAIADLLGLASRPAPGASVRLRDVEDAVQEISGQPLTALLTSLYGPIENAAAVRSAEADARRRLWSWLDGHPLVVERGLQRWAAEAQAWGVRSSVEATRDVLDQALVVLGELPANDEPLPALAGRMLNDTHALDPSTRLSTLVLSAVAVHQGLPRPERAASRRALWRSVGVTDDALSSTVLVAGLEAVGDTRSDRLCRIGFDDRAAVCLTLDDVRAGVPTLGARTIVYVVENPAVLALSLSAFAEGPPPVICVSGWPSDAAVNLLVGLASADHRLLYHGDLDGEGVRIASHVITSTGAEPWRMSAADYRAHAASHGAPVGRVTSAPWDDELADAMRRHGVAVLEETVWDMLRDDMAARRGVRPGPD